MDIEENLDQRRSTYKDIVRKARQNKKDKDKSHSSLNKREIKFLRNKKKDGKDSFVMRQLAAMAEKNKQLATSLVQSKHLNNEMEQSLMDTQHTQMAMLMKYNSKQVEMEDMQEKLLKAETQNKRLSRLLTDVRRLLDENLICDDEGLDQSNISEQSLKTQKPQRIKIFFDEKTTNTQLNKSDGLEEKSIVDEEINLSNKSTEVEMLNNSCDRQSIVISDTSFDPDNFMFDFEEQAENLDNSTAPCPATNGKRRTSHFAFQPKSGKKHKRSSNQSPRKANTETEVTDIPEDTPAAHNLSIATPLAPRLSTAKCLTLTKLDNNANQQNPEKPAGGKTKRARKSRKSTKAVNVEEEKPNKKIKLESIEENKENKSVRKTWPLSEPEDTKSKQTRRSESKNEPQESGGRSRRNKKQINYLEPSLGKKLRQGDKIGDGWLTK
uniref:Uncharacterized protein LOC100177943 n=1 Tax=Phallusia mammillata TaxID=59560 RepID=A0A6F9DG79_9ASCI|nr:uncharacterized protein LOC100177943 [Phallusia mammillata]